MKDVDEVFSQEKVKENGEKVRLVAYFSGVVEMTIGDKLITVATRQTGVNIMALLNFSDEEIEIIKDFFEDLLKIDISEIVKKTIEAKHKATLN